LRLVEESSPEVVNSLHCSITGLTLLQSFDLTLCQADPLLSLAPLQSLAELTQLRLDWPGMNEPDYALADA
jgi:hypothetical protein